MSRLGHRGGLTPDQQWWYFYRPLRPAGSPAFPFRDMGECEALFARHQAELQALARKLRIPLFAPSEPAPLRRVILERDK